MGFKLDGLTKLRDVKTADNKANLLNVLANVLDSRNPHALGFFHDMSAVEDARKGMGKNNGRKIKRKLKQKTNKNNKNKQKQKTQTNE
jgi:Formin Homology 2 Domain